MLQSCGLFKCYWLKNFSQNKQNKLEQNCCCLMEEKLNSMAAIRLAVIVKIRFNVQQ